MVGVGRTPTSTTSHPAASSPHCTACWSMGPLVRVTRPTTTRPDPTYDPNACAKASASDGVRNSPTTPRIPETPIFSRCSRGIGPHCVEQTLEEGGGRRSALFADDAHHRLGVADANVKPMVRPLNA